MSDTLLSRKELIEQARVSEKVLKEWESAKIIKPVSLSEDKMPLFSAQTVETINNIKKLVEIGYSMTDVDRILRKVGLPKLPEELAKSKGSNSHLTIGGLAEQAGVSPRTIKHWEDKGIIEPDMRTDGGFRLYSKAYIYLCKLIKDLQLFGYTLEQIKLISDLFRTFLALEENIQAFPYGEAAGHLEAMLRETGLLSDKMKLFKEGIVRWEDLINKKKKEIDSLKKRNQKRGEANKGGKNE
jgi:DNA-binding transcriptional MerR regulator